ncbi:hypothetical protein PHYBLDRAFT_141906 [Phycomyces blakesleeanus NRRL 1555(-)]|uniref:Uncharacterized protein n=1 Tax=Phycomyces blakesleeanus (strain ATCC 8743b / DSM 1359 / FGSC 10004 / NBRC 33097 / NRRL 1555) TaxID=763407 RepID=A0A162Y2U2_PHYB8|nr:hypothetical protein PHYBLDRAFT_141906 [Phycomyces blakesleeanus NRRL 1555(-)]OAD78045.1 hypothetical protein PHYBLDRAFT_141906 [Phycomyces blakesleeanus NRRL 1555(-)]|eukprot:XP_018296085.1 hypothetical protein PHYBLDRAFT_141906 [Phycomyces blakesleeanus NRRL 1555(-)]
MDMQNEDIDMEKDFIFDNDNEDNVNSDHNTNLESLVIDSNEIEKETISFDFEQDKTLDVDTESSRTSRVCEFSFQPFDDQTHSSGAIYLSINNLLQSKNLKPENIILVGMMLGPKEAGTDRISYYLEPFITKLIDLYSDVSMTDYRNTQLTVRAALMCVACDIPAARKTSGFTGYMIWCTIIDPMHNLYLETAKQTINIWRDSKLINDKDFLIMQELVNGVVIPSGYARITKKIGDAFSFMKADKLKL